jgi:hypothetical protein
MNTHSMVDVAGRRRSPATLHGYHAGRPPMPRIPPGMLKPLAERIVGYGSTYSPLAKGVMRRGYLGSPKRAR